MTGYYSNNLASERLEQCYRIAPPRIVRYLEAELAHALSRIKPGDEVLDEGCGYGRLMPSLAAKAGTVTGIDTSPASLRSARDRLKPLDNCHLACMDAARTAFSESVFDVVLCLQNGISAFHVDQRELIRESLRITRPAGIALFSTYAAAFWDERLAWFRLQAEAGLLGEIDEERTGNGVIVCKDGFRATSLNAEGFLESTSDLRAGVEIVEIDGSSLFCEIRKPLGG
ncbi:MAG: class I SAM-dependent methyltransferase [bacterium]|nr:class I SAM-dependent methyltransferase [bacterium]